MVNRILMALAFAVLTVVLMLPGVAAQASVPIPPPSVPEPGTVAMLVAGVVAGVGLLLRARRK
jgi:hypothetical protein